jgi:hypothetical protein
MLTNPNGPNGAEPILKVIGGLPTGTPTAFKAAFGTGWLVELLEDYGFDPHLVHPSQCKAIASARLKNDRSMRRSWPSCCARTCCRRRGSPGFTDRDGLSLAMRYDWRRLVVRDLRCSHPVHIPDADSGESRRP